MVSLDRINSEVQRILAPLVDPSGRNWALAPGLAMGFVSPAGSGFAGFGTATIGRDERPTIWHLFALASVTKLYTGLVVARAVADKAIDLQSPINRYLRKDLQTDPRVTVQHLLTHTSGLPPSPEGLGMLRGTARRAGSMIGGGNFTREMLAECLQESCKPAFAPGSDFLYSSLGVSLLAIALQDHLGFRKTESMYKAMLLLPLNMGNTWVGAPKWDRPTQVRRVHGYSHVNGRLQSVGLPEMGILAGGGGVMSNAGDVMQLLLALTGKKITPLENAINECTRSLSPLFGFSLRRVTSKVAGMYYFSDGVVPGFSSILLWRRDPPVGLVMLANRGGSRDEKFGPMNNAGHLLVEWLAESS